MSDKPFLDANYEVPQKSGNYMKFQDGENRFRVLSSPILGWETWSTGQDGTRKPIRRPMDKPFSLVEIEDEENVKHFWAMPVWNYAEEKIQILEVTQKGIQKSIRALSRDEDWGSPVNYDIVVTKSGQKLETEYEVKPKPAKKLDPGITQLYTDTFIDLKALYRGDDPFQVSDQAIADDAENEGI